jgi:hypothetical protein
MPTGTRTHFLGMALAIAVACFVPLAHASSITYTYTGNAYSSLSNFSCTAPGLCGIEGSLTLSAPLDPNQYYSSVSPTSFSFGDGQDTFTQANSTVFNFYFATDASGNITGWDIGLQDNADTSYFYSQFGPAYVTGQDIAYDQYPTSGSAVSYAAGTWSSAPVSETPEPASGALLATGGLLLLGLGLRRV